MKPIQITMQAFGCYLSRTVIDFAKLGQNPIFLITGATGGGKTTILDAMCFALYCKATGGRRSWESMICAAAPQEAETLVDFTFSLGGDTYRFTRSQQRYAARGTGVMKIKEEHNCYRLAGSEWERYDLPNTETKVREQAEKLLGLNCEQFSQVMVLPQGDFLKLLLASSRDKAQMFQTLFSTGRWAQVTLVLKKMAEDLRQEADEITAAKNLILEREEAETFEQLEEKCSLTEKQLETAKAELALLEKEQEQRNTRYNTALTLDKKFQNRDTLRGELESLEKKREEIEQKRGSLHLSRLARNVIPYYTAYQTAQKDCAAKTRELDAAHQEKVRAEAEQKAADGQAAAAKDCRETVTSLAQAFSKLDSARVGAQRLKKIRTDLSAAEKRLKAQNTRQEQLVAALKDAQERYHKGQEYAAKAQEEALRIPRLVEEIQKIMNQDKAAALSAGLAEGQPCPVCGSVHHPAPAKPSERLQAAQAELEAAKQSGEALKKYEKRLKELEEIQRQEQQKFEEGKAQTAELEKEQASLQSAEKELQTSLGEYDDADRIEKEIKSVQTGIDRETRRANQIEQRISAAQNALAAAGAAAQAAEKACAESAQAVSEAKTRLEAEAAAANLKPDTEFSKIVFTATEEAALEQEINDYAAACRSKQEQLAQLEQELRDTEKPDTASAKQLLTEAQQKNSETAKLVGSLLQRADSVQKSLKKLAELIKEGSSLEERYSRTSRLAAMLAGKTGLKIPLHQFVLGIMLDDILSCANITFSTLSNGRYRLSRVTGASGGNALGGLDLQVFDAYSGGVRAVETLSGGELFLASLSLAFGLSDVVQNYSGSVHLDSIFIDEGFGSLDQETLDTAMKALLQIRQTGRTIGIISHVSEIKTRIAAQIVVSKGSDGGSRAEVLPG